MGNPSSRQASEHQTCVLLRMRAHLNRDVGRLPCERAPAAKGEQVAEQQKQGDIAHHPVHLLAKDGGAAQGLEESPEGPPRARSPGRLLALVLARALLLGAAGLALTLALTSNPPAAQRCPEPMLRPSMVQEAMRACNAQLPEGLVCPMRDMVSPSHALF